MLTHPRFVNFPQGALGSHLWPMVAAIGIALLTYLQSGKCALLPATNFPQIVVASFGTLAARSRLHAQLSPFLPGSTPNPVGWTPILVFPPLFSLPQSSGGFPSMVWAGFPLFPPYPLFFSSLMPFPGSGVCGRLLPPFGRAFRQLFVAIDHSSI